MNSEELARWLSTIRQNRVRDATVADESDLREYSPPPPAAGPGFVCGFCGQVVKQLHPDPEKARYERKWRVHWRCRRLIERYAEILATPPAMRHWGALYEAIEEVEQELRNESQPGGS